MSKTTYITNCTPADVRITKKDRAILDELCERTGFPWDELPDAVAVRETNEITSDPAWGADSFNAGDWLGEYLELTSDEVLVLDIDAIMATPVRREYMEREHLHGMEVVPGHE